MGKPLANEVCPGHFPWGTPTHRTFSCRVIPVFTWSSDRQQREVWNLEGHNTTPSTSSDSSFGLQGTPPFDGQNACQSFLGSNVVIGTSSRPARNFLNHWHSKHWGLFSSFLSNKTAYHTDYSCSSPPPKAGTGWQAIFKQDTVRYFSSW